MNCLKQLDLTELELLHSGKVRDSYRATPDSRLIVVTDRLSAFDFILDTPIPNKGAVLNGIAAWWFDQTTHIIPNHLIRLIDPNVSLVREAVPIRVEMVVRGYLTGSIWRGYEQGERLFSGAAVSNGLQKNNAFATPIVTPTTKEKSDRPISPADIVREGWASKKHYEQMHETALQLFGYATQRLSQKGLLLVDTKYEFGLIDGQVVLIDEIHTPDSSRFWQANDYAQNPAQATQIDKEYIRQWMLANLIDGDYPHSLPQYVVEEAEKRYLQLYQTVTGNALLINDNQTIDQRIRYNLQREGFM